MSGRVVCQCRLDAGDGRRGEGRGQSPGTRGLHYLPVHRAQTTPSPFSTQLLSLCRLLKISSIGGSDCQCSRLTRLADLTPRIGGTYLNGTGVVGPGLEFQSEYFFSCQPAFLASGCLFFAFAHHFYCPHSTRPSEHKESETAAGDSKRIW